MKKEGGKPALSKFKLADPVRIYGLVSEATVLGDCASGTHTRTSTRRFILRPSRVLSSPTGRA